MQRHHGDGARQHAEVIHEAAGEGIGHGVQGIDEIGQGSINHALGPLGRFRTLGGIKQLQGVIDQRFARFAGRLLELVPEITTPERLEVRVDVSSPE